MNKLCNFSNNGIYLKYYDKNTGKLFLPNEFSGNLKKNNLPLDIKEIEFDRKTPLELNKSFNKSIDELPDCINKLTLSVGFNKPIIKLPKKLEYLNFDNFNQPLNKTIFPENLKSIIFGSYFNQSIDCLPDTIEHLRLGHFFSLPINKFPKSLKILHSFNFLSKYPHGLKKIKVDFCEKEIIDNLPDSVEKLTICKGDFKINNFPKNLLKIKFPIDFNKKIGCRVHSEDNFMIQEGITHLKFKGYYNQPIDDIPNSITQLVLGMGFNQSLDNLPNSLTHLVLKYGFNQTLDNLPFGIKEITVDDDYDKLTNNLPLSIEKIIIRNEKQKDLFKKLPFDCKISIVPLNTEYLGFGFNYKKI